MANDIDKLLADLARRMVRNVAGSRGDFCDDSYFRYIRDELELMYRLVDGQDAVDDAVAHLGSPPTDG